MNNSSGAVLRGDLLTYVEEASSVDKLFIADKVLPMYPVDLKDGRYPKFTLAGGSELLDGDISTRRPGGSYKRVQRDFTEDTYSTADRGIEESVDDTSKKEFSRFFQQETIAARMCLRRMKIAAEIRAAAAMFNSSNFTATAATVSYTSAHVADGTLDPIADILAAIDKMNALGYMPNTMVIPYAVFTLMRRSTKLQNYIRGNRPSDTELKVNSQTLADAFDIEQVLIARAPKNTAKKGQPTVTANIWPTTYIGLYDIQSGDPYAGGAGRTFVWNEEGGLYVAESYRDEEVRSDIVRVRHHTIEKIIDANAGQLVTTSYA